MELIDRYVYAVTERLPEDSREDVARELRANIEDMLPENAVEKDVRSVLEKLGNPVLLSNEYRQEKRYVIGPALYDSYISVLKLVVGIAVIVFSFIALLSNISKPLDNSDLLGMAPGFIAGIISAAFQGAVQAFLWVTVIFVILERSGAGSGNLSFIKKKWTVDDLQLISVSGKGRISRTETIISLAITILFTALIVLQPQVIGWYGKTSDGITLIAPLFNIGQLKFYIPAFILLAILQLGLSAYKLISMRWTLPLAIFNTANNLVLCVFIGIMFSDNAILNSDFISHIANITKTSLSHMTSIWKHGMMAFIILFIIGCAIDSISGLVKCGKGRIVL